MRERLGELLKIAAATLVLGAGGVAHADDGVGSRIDAICCGGGCCLIEGTCYTNGDMEEGDACNVCDTSVSRTMFTRRDTPECAEAMDAGPMDEDAGPADEDAGPMDEDAGPADEDAGSADVDAGSSGTDSGPSGTDSGTSSGTDAGGGGGGGGGCSAAGGSAGGALLFALVALGWRRES